jgi:hypothetical protein
MAMIRRILWLLATFLLAHVQLVAAQHPVKNARIGFLFFGSKDQPHLQSFHHGLRELGYIEGKNISIEYRYAEGESDALPSLAPELAALNLELIVTTTPNATPAVLRASGRVPIVAVGFDPIATGWRKAWRVQAAMLPAYQAGLVLIWRANGWTCSKKPSRESAQWRCSGILKLRNLHGLLSTAPRGAPRLL